MCLPKRLPPRRSRPCLMLWPRLLPALPASLPLSFIWPDAVGFPGLSCWADANGAATANIITAAVVSITFVILASSSYLLQTTFAYQFRFWPSDGCRARSQPNSRTYAQLIVQAEVMR